MSTDPRTSQKDLVLSGRDEFQGCVGPTRTSGCFPHRSRRRARAPSTRTSPGSRRPGPPRSRATRGPSSFRCPLPSKRRPARARRPSAWKPSLPVRVRVRRDLETRLARSKRGLFGSFLETECSSLRRRSPEVWGRSLSPNPFELDHVERILNILVSTQVAGPRLLQLRVAYAKTAADAWDFAYADVDDDVERGGRARPVWKPKC